jgi:hypothetical protein
MVGGAMKSMKGLTVQVAGHIAKPKKKHGKGQSGLRISMRVV